MLGQFPETSFKSASGRAKWAARSACTNRRPVYVEDCAQHRLQAHAGGRRMWVAGRTLRCCPGCSVRQSWSIQELIRRGLAEARPGSYVGFLTLTEPADHRPLGEHAKACSRFMEDLLKLFGGDGKTHPYLGVRELQVRGAWHSHYLVLNWRHCDLEQVRALAERHGLGRRFNVKARRVGGEYSVEGLAYYLTKTLAGYLTKVTSHPDLREIALPHLPRGARLVVHSRSWANGLTKGKVERQRLSAYREALRAPKAPRVEADQADLATALQALRDVGVLAEEPEPPPPPLPPPLPMQLTFPWLTL